MKINYDKLVCTQVKELFRTCFTKENLALFDLWELIDISNLCKQVANEADKKFDEMAKMRKNYYYKFNDGFSTFYVNTLTGEKKFELEEGDVEVESNKENKK